VLCARRSVASITYIVHYIDLSNHMIDMLMVSIDYASASVYR